MGHPQRQGPDQTPETSADDPPPSTEAQPPDALNPSPYRGRFAPSPTGPLHFGSLIAALGSYLEARARGGTWLVRMEDLDRSREVAGAAAGILRTLDAFGMHWDESVVYQSDRLSLYRDALADLRQRGDAYPCSCSRKRISATARRGREGPIYPGTCRDRPNDPARARTMRMRVMGGETAIEDALHGRLRLDIAAELGDFVIHRGDGVPAYQLAVVIDDADQGVSHVVRGADLLLSTFRQRVIQDALQLPIPGYTHLPLALDSSGRKLSKSDSARAIDRDDPVPSLKQAWSFLGQCSIPTGLHGLDEFWPFAHANWSIERVPTHSAQPSSVFHDAGVA